MGVFTPTGGRPFGTTTIPPVQGTPQRITIVAADTEQAVALPAGLQYYSVVNRGKTILKVSFTANGTNTAAHYTLYPNGGYTSPAIFVAAASTMYIQTAKAGDVIDIITYT